jgi:hypothetical protein
MTKRHLLIIATVLAPAAMAQETQQRITQERVQIFTKAVPAPGGADVLTYAPQTMGFVSSEMSWEEKLVKGAPYSAEAVTETTQMLVDGNRIARKNVAQVYRDSEGRTRREQSLDSVGPWASGKPHKTIFVNDPVAGLNYVLDPEARTARKITLPKNGGGNAFFFHREVSSESSGPLPAVMPLEAGVAVAGVAAREVPGPENKNYRQEPLGKQTIEGVQAEGTRSVVTIAAGEIGNDRPIEIASERWFSPDLQTVVMTRRSDPRFGDTTYKLTNIRREEPVRSLFEVPADYSVKEAGSMEMKMKMEKEFKEFELQRKKKLE